MKREYVIVCNEHNGWFPGAMLFWGHHTEDDEARSFGGYTCNLDKCERYTLEEILEHGYDFPVYHLQSSEIDFRNIPDIIITVDELLSLDWLKTAKIVYRP